ncbi:hypothetical protein FYK55_10155 [Roseiconus nitratireducens]|uniref:Uncharacterized protein n=1 Tax=Roseiconus nitratireducens TaxID=2605748 RepID=A0A5M6DAR9_9BACT|nr:hypothetical protein [Roseiconus nitratireducens]KAA5544658.1 hypothetical protein FYK55_10155 [Roseiconus nitratireducens]
MMSIRNRLAMPFLAAALVVVLGGNGVRAELVIGVANQPVLIDFQGFNGGGLQPGGGAGTLDSNDWSIEFFDVGGSQFSDFGESSTSGLFAGGTVSGAMPAPGLYAVDTGGGNVAMGIQAGIVSGGSPTELAGVDPILRIRNQTGVVFDAVYVDYDLWVFNGSDENLYVDPEALGESATIEFNDSIDGIPGFTTDLAASANPEWTRTEQFNDLFLPASVFIGGPTIDPLEDGQTLGIRWSIGGVADQLGRFDGVAIDNIRVTGVNFVTAVPEPGAAVFLAIAALVPCCRRRRRN